MWDVSLALKMTLRTDYYADAERFEIQGEEGIIQVTRCSDRMLDEPALTLYRGGEVRAFHNLDADWGGSFARSTRHFLDVLAGREPQEVLTAREGRRVIALYDLFQRSNAERRAGSPRPPPAGRKSVCALKAHFVVRVPLIRPFGHCSRHRGRRAFSAAGESLGRDGARDAPFSRSREKVGMRATPRAGRRVSLSSRLPCATLPRAARNRRGCGMAGRGGGAPSRSWD